MENIAKAIMEQDHVYTRTMSTGNLNAVLASIHVYNMPGEIDRLVAAMRQVAKKLIRLYGRAQGVVEPWARADVRILAFAPGFAGDCPLASHASAGRRPPTGLD